MKRKRRKSRKMQNLKKATMMTILVLCLYLKPLKLIQNQTKTPRNKMVRRKTVIVISVPCLQAKNEIAPLNRLPMRKAMKKTSVLFPRPLIPKPPQKRNFHPFLRKSVAFVPS